ncbi:hypothetical protein CRE_11321 [Caenorhabditis remanei]|uniref:Uncharacterized protein n=1 Tax=Caenorhabditis remanei TaxID=31234 RepID=E3N0I6_CAERE|nr:hypothetical protein CRE_11321 [Caenorhabditis remanei]
MSNRYSFSRDFQEKIQILGKFFQKRKFLKKKDKAVLCKQTGFPESFINNWFIQRRKILRRESRSSIDSTSSDLTEVALMEFSTPSLPSEAMGLTPVFDAPLSLETESTFGEEAPLLVSCSPDTSIDDPGARPLISGGSQQYQGLLMIAQPQNQMSTAFMSPPTSSDSSENSGSPSPKTEVITPFQPPQFDALDNKDYSFTTQETTSAPPGLSDQETIKTLINIVCAYNLQVQSLLDNQAMMNNQLQAYANALVDLQRQQPHSGPIIYYSKDQEEKLREQFKKKPYIKFEERKKLGDEIGLTEAQVMLWFRENQSSDEKGVQKLTDVLEELNAMGPPKDSANPNTNSEFQ